MPQVHVDGSYKPNDGIQNPLTLNDIIDQKVNQAKQNDAHSRGEPKLQRFSDFISSSTDKSTTDSIMSESTVDEINEILTLEESHAKSQIGVKVKNND